MNPVLPYVQRAGSGRTFAFVRPPRQPFQFLVAHLSRPRRHMDYPATCTLLRISDDAFQLRDPAKSRDTTPSGKGSCETAGKPCALTIVGRADALTPKPPRPPRRVVGPVIRRDVEATQTASARRCHATLVAMSGTPLSKRLTIRANSSVDFYGQELCLSSGRYPRPDCPLGL